jgi:hypothetical protein
MTRTIEAGWIRQAGGGSQRVWVDVWCRLDDGEQPRMTRITRMRDGERDVEAGAFATEEHRRTRKNPGGWIRQAGGGTQRVWLDVWCRLDDGEQPRMTRITRKRDGERDVETGAFATEEHRRTRKMLWGYALTVDANGCGLPWCGSDVAHKETSTLGTGFSGSTKNPVRTCTVAFDRVGAKRTEYCFHARKNTTA